MKKYLFAAVASLFFLLSSCGRIKDVSNTKPRIYTSFYTLYDFTQKIGGNKINLKNIMPSSIEPHDWEPSVQDIINLENADVLIYNGSNLEHWIDKVKNTLQNEIRYVNLTEDLKIENDPHVWLNPLIAKEQLHKILDVLSEIDPQNQNYYRENYLMQAEKIDELDKKIRDAVKNFKFKNIVVAHRAYKYFCDEYGLNQIALEGADENSEPTIERMREVTDFIGENNVRYVFYEGVPSKSIKVISNDTGIKLLELNPFEYLTDKQISNGEDYFSVMEKNLENLKVALE